MQITVDDVVLVVRSVLTNKGAANPQVSPDTTLGELEFDSLDLAEALILLEDKAGRELGTAGVGRIERVRDILRLAIDPEA